MRIDRTILALLYSLSVLPTAGGPAAEPRLGLHLSPCGEGKAKIPAKCGTFGVYENRQAHSGRVIALHVIVVPAKHAMHRAMVEIAGGPGRRRPSLQRRSSTAVSGRRASRCATRTILSSWTIGGWDNQIHSPAI